MVFEEKSFVTHWATSFSHSLVKHDVPSDHWRIGLKNVLKKNNKIEKTISTGIDMVFWRKKSSDPMSDILFTFLGQTWCPKWSLKDWTKKDVLRNDEKIKKPYLHWPGTDMVFWSFCHFGYINIKYFTSTGLTMYHVYY